MNKYGTLKVLVMLELMVVAGLWVSAPAVAEGESLTPVLEEVIVTARRRDEKLMDIPAAISVISEADHDLLVLDDLADYLRQIPGAVLVNSGPEYLSDISMRGQGGGRLGFSESATGIFRNGLYVAGGGFGGRSLSRMDFFDMESLQVYRGPQGALYGRNAVGGAINVISKRPGDTFEGWAKIGYNDFDRFLLESVINLPVVEDKFALRLGGYYLDQSDGFITDINTGKTLDRSEQKGVRVAAQLQQDENFTVNLTIEYRESEAAGFSSLGFREFRTDRVPLDPSRFERDVSTDGRVVIDETTVFLQMLWETSVGEVHADFNYKTRDGARSNGDFDHFIGFQNRAFGGRPVEMFSDQTEDFSRYSGMLYLTSTDTSSRWNWLLGTEFQSYDDGVETRISGDGVIAPLNNLRRTDIFHEELESLAIFGSLDVDLTDRWSLALEARLQNDSKDFTFDRVPESAPRGAISLVEGKEWTRVTPGATLSYKLSDGHLIYGRLATGYRPGGFNSGIPADIPDVGNLVAFGPEYIKSAELGWKGPLFGRHLRADLAVFYAETGDVQAVTYPSPTSNGVILQNAGDNNTWGFEFQVQGLYEVGPGELRLTLGFSAVDGEWKEGSAVIASGKTVDISGTRVNRTRDLIANIGLAYSVPVSGNLMFVASGSYQSESGGYENVITTRKMQAFDLFDARLSLLGESWKCSVFVKNLTDKIYRLQQLSQNDYFNQRRSYGVSVTYLF